MNKLMDTFRVKKAMKVAQKAHEGQTRWGGEPYITHPIAVASSFEGDEELQVVGLLHDVVEDTDVTMDDISSMFGPETANCVKYLTKGEDEDYVDYIQRLGSGPKASIQVKLEDLKHNLSDIKRGQRRDKYRLAELYLLSVLGRKMLYGH